MRLGFPPVEAGEEVDHDGVPVEHHHGVITAAVDPSSTRIGPDARAALGGFAGGLVSARHGDLPRCAAIGIRAMEVWKAVAAAVRIVILVAVLLVGLRNGAAEF